MIATVCELDEKTEEFLMSATGRGTQSASQTTMEGQCAMSGAAWGSARE